MEIACIHSKTCEEGQYETETVMTRIIGLTQRPKKSHCAGIRGTDPFELTFQSETDSPIAAPAFTKYLAEDSSASSFEVDP